MKAQISMRRTFRICFCAVSCASLSVAAAIAWQDDFQWDWRRNKELTREESLRKSKLSRAEKLAISKAIADQIRPDMYSSGFESEEQLEQTALDARIKMVDLKGDGTAEVIVQAAGAKLCSPTGNCPLWLFQKTRRGYKQLLSDSAQSFTIEQTRTNGFRDIVVAMHASASSSQLTVYKYADDAYHSVACYSADWTVLEGDTLRELKEPRITPCSTRWRMANKLRGFFGP